MKGSRRERHHVSMCETEFRRERGENVNGRGEIKISYTFKDLLLARFTSHTTSLHPYLIRP
jgi:hypothetical protein